MCLAGCGVPQRSTLWPLLFPADIDDLDVGNKLIEFADATKSKIEVTSQQQVKFKTDLGLLFKWSRREQMKLYVYKWKVRHAWLQSKFMNTN